MFKVRKFQQFTIFFQEREAARDLFKSKKGKVLAKEIAQKSKFLSAEVGSKAPIGIYKLSQAENKL